MSEMIYKAKGSDGVVKLYEHKVVLEPKGVLGRISNMGNGTKEIMIDDITSIQFKDGGFTTKGYIQFGESGHKNVSGVTKASGDANSVLFKRKQQDDFEELRERVNELRSESDNGSESEGNESSEDTAVQQLRERYAEGEISKEEYEERLAVLEETE